MRSLRVDASGVPPLMLKGSVTTRADERGVLASVFYVAGGLVALVAQIDPQASSPWLFAMAGLTIAVAVTSFPARRWFTYAATIASSLLGPVLITAAIVAGGGGWASAVAASLYAFVAVHTALVLRWRHAVLVLLWAALTALTAARLVVAQIPSIMVLALFLLVCGTLSGVTAWLVHAMRRQAATDPLTGLANRATFTSGLEQACATVTRTGEALSLVALDLDGFKQVNDTRGHAAGDAVLIAVSRAWSAEMRGRDVLARPGGDEFCVILPGADLEEARRIAQRLTGALPPGTACSSGVATWVPRQELDELVRDADRALYAAKYRREEPGSATPTSDGWPVRHAVD